MEYADAIRRQAEDAPRVALPAVAAALWGALADGKVTEAEAEVLSGLIEARRTRSGGHPQGQRPNPTGTGAATTTDGAQGRRTSPRRPGVGSRPRTDASMERRRRWAAAGRIPPRIAARFTLAEQAVLALVAAETARRGDCRLPIEHIAAVAGVCRSTVKNAIREARKLGLVTVEERKVTGFRNLPNIVRIVGPDWVSWMRLARSGTQFIGEGVGVKSVTGTRTQVLESGNQRPADPSKCCREAAGRVSRADVLRICAGGGSGG